MDLENTMMLILSELKDMRQDISEIKQEQVKTNQRLDKIEQNMATQINAQTTMSQELSAKDEKIEKVQRQHSYEIMQLKAQ